MTVMEQTDVRRFSDLLATKVMGWELWRGDWYTPWDTVTQRRDFRFHLLVWNPLKDALATQLVWTRCLLRARVLGIELTQRLDDRGWFHINGDHPVGQRLLVIDPDYNVAVCRLAAQLFDFPAPHLYAGDPVSRQSQPGL